MQRTNTLQLFILLIIICVVYLLINRLYKHREFFEDKCSVDISSITKANVIKNLHLSAHYDPVDKTHSKQSNELLAKLKASSQQLDDLEGILTKIYNNNECKTQYFTILNIYAQNNGLVQGPAERQSSFRGLLAYLNMCSHYYLYAKQIPTNPLSKSPKIRTWLTKMCDKWSAQFKNYKNNQHLILLL